MSEDLRPGLYEDVITEDLAKLLANLAGRGIHVEADALDSAESHLVLAKYLARVLERALQAVPETDRERVLAQIRVCNRVLGVVREATPMKDAGTDVDERGEALLAVCPPGPSHAPPSRPQVPLSCGVLLVNAKGEPSLAHEIGVELESTDRVDLLCSFIKFQGVRLLTQKLSAARQRGVPIRVLTTVYLGATDRRALDELVRLGATVKISYEWRRTRLHAKAWFLHRDSGLSTAYIGSSNLSKSAMSDGLEWNVRLSSRETPDILRSFEAAFASYWDGDDFEAYDPERDSARLDQALADASGSAREGKAAQPWISVQLSPWPFQQEILERVRAEREVHGRNSNLVVAATGTGKTMIAAFDYRDLRSASSAESLLFVAHREELLDQALGTFRLVLREPDFGEKFAGGRRPKNWKHVFASVQSLANLRLEEKDPAAFDMVIVDEFHHAAAPTYRRLLEYLKPKYLLGLTATPERADTQDVLTWFDGRIAAEMRLWDALEKGLLAPFHYFGINDETSLAGVAWKRGYDSGELDKIYTGNRIRAMLIAQEVEKRVTDPRRMRALGFCVSVAHAQFMAGEFERLGIPSLAVTGEDLLDERNEARRKLVQGSVSVLFTVDLFNEGVDIPEVDTLLFLRPTESATLFIQQLGRGLRLCDGKACTTVLDFIGPARREFRFEERYRALTGHSGGVLQRHVRDNFPFLPAGCSIQLDRVARDIILENLKSALQIRKDRLVEIARRLHRDRGTVLLPEFLDEAGLTPETFYSTKRSLTSVLREAGLAPEVPSAADESRLGGVLGRLLAINDPERIRAARWLCGKGDPSALPIRERRALAMLHFDFWGLMGAPSSLEDSVRRIRACSEVVREISSLLDWIEDRADSVTTPLDFFPDVPLRVHGRFSRDEVLAAMGDSTPEKPRPLREGVRFDPVHRADLLFVTLRKSEREFSPTTMYRDYARTPTLFHWQSQSTTSAESPTGRRYAGHATAGTSVLLFVRESKDDDFGMTRPFVFLGPVDYVSHEGERPMSILWRLRTAMPAGLLKEAQVAAG